MYIDAPEAGTASAVLTQQPDGTPAWLPQLTVTAAANLTAYAGPINRATFWGVNYTYAAGSGATVDGVCVLSAAGKGAGRWLRDIPDGIVNVKWFGAIGNGVANDTAAINAAMAFARTQVADAYGAYRPTVIFPAGFYRTSGVNATNCNGIFVRGAGGSFVNTTLIGIGDGDKPMLDFTGSSQFKCDGFTFVANKNELTCSTIGILCALGQVSPTDGTNTGGLNGTIRNCYFQMDSIPTANAGLGTVGIMNCRSEEFGIEDCFIRANTPVVYTNKRDISAELGSSYTVTSQFATVCAGFNSMTVINMSGNTSLQAIDRRGSAIVAINTGSLFFKGYIGQYGGTTGTEKTAIKLIGQAQNMSFGGTIEGFPRLARLANINNDLEFQLETANQTDTTTELFDATGSLVKDSKFQVTFPLVADIGGRTFMYHAPVGGGDQPGTGTLINCQLACSDWINNGTFVSANLLNMSSNTSFHTGQPFRLDGGYLTDLKRYPIPMGTTVATAGSTAENLIRFDQANNATTTTNNAGYYHAVVRGTILIGNESSSNLTVADFEGKVMVVQNASGGRSVPQSDVIIQNVLSTDASVNTITDISLSMSFDGTVRGAVSCNVSYTGSAAGLPVRFLGQVSVLSKFKVNQAIIYN